MKKLSFIVFITCLICASCSNDEDSQKEDSQKLEKMHDEILKLSLSNSQTCTNAEEWDFIGINLSACGGVNSFVIYSKKINKTEFLAKVEKYLDAQAEYNEKWKIINTCDMIIHPSGVECVDGKPKLTYSTGAYY